MSGSESQSAQVLELAEKFLERYRAGQRPALREYIDRYPELADEIREVFPAMAMMENVALADESLADNAPANLAGSGVRPSDDIPAAIGDFRIIRELGRGGMGVVYEAEQVSLGRHVALKVLPRNVFDKPKQRQRFEREAKAAAKLHHTNIVPVFGVGEENGLGYYVMQFIQGLALDEVLEELKQIKSQPNMSSGTVKTGELRVTRRDVSAADVAHSLMTGTLQQPTQCAADNSDHVAETNVTVDHAVEQARSETSNTQSDVFSTSSARSSDIYSISDSSLSLSNSANSPHHTYWRSVAQIGGQAAMALEYAHDQGVLHRDIKPANLLLDVGGRLWVTDFGLAKLDDDRNLTQTGDILGTLRYMAPETFKGKADARSEVYSLGLTLYEMLALKPAFGHANRSELVDQVLTARVESLEKINPEIPRDLQTIIHKSIEREGSHRYQSAGEMADDLQRFLDDEPIKARRISVPERIGRWSRRNKSLAAALAAIALLLLAANIGGPIVTILIKQAYDEAMQANRNAETMLADMHTERGFIAAAEGELASASLWFAEASKLAEHDLNRRRQNQLRMSNWSRKSVVPIAARDLGGQPQSFEFRPGSDMLLIRTAHEVVIYDWQRDKFLPWASPEEKDIRVACWSPDGQFLAAGYDSGLVEIRNVADGAVIADIQHQGAITALAFSRSGRYLAFSSHLTRVWDVGLEAPLQPSWHHPEAVRSLVFGAHENLLATVSDDTKVRVFSISSQLPGSQPLLGPINHKCAPDAPVFVDDDRYLVTLTSPQQVTWWDIATGKKNNQISDVGAIRQLLSDNQGRRLVVCGNNAATIHSVDSPSEILGRLEHSNRTTDVAYSADGSTLLSVSWDQEAKLWSATDGQPIAYPLSHSAAVECCAISSDGSLLATGQASGLLKVWRRAASTTVATLAKPWGWRPRISTGGRWVAPGRLHEDAWQPKGSTRVTVLNRQTGAAAGPAIFLKNPLYDSCVCSDEKTLATIEHSDRSGHLSFWHFSTGSPLGIPRSLPAKPISVAARPDTDEVAVLCGNGRVLVFAVDDASARLTFSLEDWEDSDRSWPRVQYTPDGASLIALTGGMQNAVHVVDAGNGKPRFDPIRPVIKGGPCRTLGVSNSGRLLATGVNGSNAVQVWSLETGRPLSKPIPHPGDLYGVFGIQFSPDEKLLLSVSKDGFGRLWDWRDRKLVGQTLEHADEVWTGIFTPGGKYCVTGSRDGQVRIWDTGLGKLVAPPIQLGASVLSIRLTADGQTLFVTTSNRITSRPLDMAVARIDLSELLDLPQIAPKSQILVAELAAGQVIKSGGVRNLLINEWLERWEKLRAEEPQFGQLSPRQSVLAHRRAASALLDVGDLARATAHFNQVLKYLELSELNDQERGQLLAEIHQHRAKSFSRLGDQSAVLASLQDAQEACLQYLNGRVCDEQLAEIAIDVTDLCGPQWQVLAPGRVISTGGSTLEVQEDLSVLARGTLPDVDSYTFHSEGPNDNKIYAIRLEVIPDPTMTNGGMGRCPTAGDFRLESLQVELQDGEAHSATLRLRDRLCTNAVIGNGLDFAIDDTPGTNWIPARSTQPAIALFLVRDPGPGADASKLVFKMKFGGGGHSIGRFRFALASRPSVIVNELLSEDRSLGRIGGREALAAAWLAAGMADRAAEALSSAGDDLSDGLTVSLLTIICHRTGDSIAARQWYEKAIKSFQEETPCQLTRHFVRQAMLEIEELTSDQQDERIAQLDEKRELADLDAEVAKDPAKADNYISRSVAYARREQWEQAAADSHEALERLPAGRNFHSARSQWIKRLWREHEPVMEHLVKLRPNDTLLQTCRGRDFILQEKYEQALECYAEVIDRVPVGEEWYEYAALLVLTGDMDGYRECVHKLVDKSGESDDTFTMYVLARTTALVPEPVVDPEEIVRWAEASGNRSAWFRHATAIAYLRAGKTETARQFVNHSLQQTWRPGFPLNHLVLALICEREGDMAAARSEVKTVEDRIAQQAAEDEHIYSRLAEKNYHFLAETDLLEYRILQREAESLGLTAAESAPQDPNAYQTQAAL